MTADATGFDRLILGPPPHRPPSPGTAGDLAALMVENERLRHEAAALRRERDTDTAQADSSRYRQLGNAVAVPVVEWIMRRIVSEDAR